MTKERRIEILESKISDPSISSRDLKSLSRELSLLKGESVPYDRRPVAQRQPPEPKPLAPPPSQPDDSTPEEKALLHKAQQSWREWSKQFPRESADFLLVDVYEKRLPGYLDSLSSTDPGKLAGIRIAEVKWRECWAEYDAYYQHQTQSFSEANKMEKLCKQSWPALLTMKK